MIQQERIEQLFRNYYQEMYQMARILLHDNAESKDAVSEVFVHLMSRDQDLKEGSERAFLLRSVRNYCLNVIRSRSIQQRIQRLYLLDIQTNICSIESMERELEEIRGCIETELSESDRHILMLHYRQRLTYKKIAEQEGISDVAVYKHLRRALDLLRDHFKKQNENG